jgi:elongator complex protein 1
MSLHKLALTQKPIDVAFSMSGARLAVLSDTDVAVYAYDPKQRPIPLPTLLWRSTSFVDVCPRHVVFRGDDEICVLTDAWDEDESSIWLSEGDNLLNKGPILEAVQVSSITSSVDIQDLYVHFQDGGVHEMLVERQSSDLTLQTAPKTNLPTVASEARIVQVNGNVRIRSFERDCANVYQSVAFGLTKSGVLYANERMLVRNCTSFVVTSAHLIFTTTQHLLKFVHLTSPDGTRIPFLCCSS